MSNWRPDRIQQAIDYAQQHQLAGPIASSPNYSLAEQIDSPWGDDCITVSGLKHAEDRQWYQQQGMPLFTWSSLARGFLSGRLSRDNVAEVGPQFEEHTLRCYACDDNWTRPERAAQLAEQYHCSVAQIASAFVLNSPIQVHALVSYSEEEVHANAAAVDIQLSTEECAWLDLQADKPPATTAS